MTVLGPDVLSVSAGRRYPWILQAVFTQGQDTALPAFVVLRVRTASGWVRRGCCYFSLFIDCRLPHSTNNLPVSLPQSCLPGFSAADWAVAVCTQMEGKAGGSPIVAKGSGNAKGMQGALTTALEFAQSKL